MNLSFIRHLFMEFVHLLSLFWAFAVDFIQPSNNLRGSNLEVEQDMSGGNLHFNGSMNSDIGERKFSSLHSSFPSVHGRDVQTFESVSSSSDIRSSTNHVQQFPGTSEPNSRRTRPSFLDSLNVPRAPSALQSTEPQKQQSIPSTLNSDGMDDPGSSAFQKATAQNESVGEQLMKFSVSSSNGFDLMSQNVNENGLERKHELYSSKQNEDFAALEQVIIFLWWRCYERRAPGPRPSAWGVPGGLCLRRPRALCLRHRQAQGTGEACPCPSRCPL